VTNHLIPPNSVLHQPAVGSDGCLLIISLVGLIDPPDSAVIGSGSSTKPMQKISNVGKGVIRMVNGKMQFTCDLCSEPYGKPWHALMGMSSEPTNTDFSFELCQGCYNQINRAIVQVMQQNLRTETAKLKQQTAGLKILVG